MLDTTLWMAQGFLALFFLAVGVPKVIGRGMSRWTGFEDLPRVLVLTIGACEVAAVIGLVAPMAVGRDEWTTPLAAIGLSVVSLMASGFHIRQAERLPAIETVLWAMLAGSIAIGRWGEITTGPSLPTNTLVGVMAVVVAALIGNLAVLLRRPLATAPPR